jgi:hypothetical protein
VSERARGEAPDTLRQRLADLLAERAMTARDLSQALGIPEKEVYPHLAHVARSARTRGRKLIVRPFASWTADSPSASGPASTGPAGVRAARAGISSRRPMEFCETGFGRFQRKRDMDTGAGIKKAFQDIAGRLKGPRPDASLTLEFWDGDRIDLGPEPRTRLRFRTPGCADDSGQRVLRLRRSLYGRGA